MVTECDWFVSSESGSSYGRLWLYFCGVWRFGVDGGLEAWGVFFGRGLRCGRHYCEAFFSVVSFGGFDLCVEGSPYFGHGGCRTFLETTERKLLGRWIVDLDLAGCYLRFLILFVFSKKEGERLWLGSADSSLQSPCPYPSRGFDLFSSPLIAYRL